MTTQANGNGAPPPSPERLRLLEHMVANATTLTRGALRQALGLDPRRSIEDECGYPALGTHIDAKTYWDVYDSCDIPARVVEVFPKECFQVQPNVYEEEDEDTTTPFEEAWYELGRTLGAEDGEDSLYQDEKGCTIFAELLNADILSGVGQYGVILLGLDDGGDLRAPPRVGKGRKLLYLRSFPEHLAQVNKLDGDPASPRYGKPLEYRITFHDPDAGQAVGGSQTVTREVHWRRCIHVADTHGSAVSSKVFARPRMRQVWPRLLDLRKVYGADAEAYWRSAVMKLFLETQPELGGDVEYDEASLRDMFENMMNGLQQWGFLRGMTAKSVAPAVVDPSPHVDKLIEAICIKLGCPVRVFKGSERGELASSQDDQAWNDRLKERQNSYLTPRLVVPFVSRLVALGVLPKPKGLSVWWPDLTSETDGQKLDNAVKKTDALAKYIQGGVEALVPPLDYLTRIMDYTNDEAEAILESAEDLAEEKEAEEMDRQKELAAAAPPAPPQPSPGAPPPKPTPAPTPPAPRPPAR